MEFFCVLRVHFFHSMFILDEHNLLSCMKHEAREMWLRKEKKVLSNQNRNQSQNRLHKWGVFNQINNNWSTPTTDIRYRIPKKRQTKLWNDSSMSGYIQNVYYMYECVCVWWPILLVQNKRAKNGSTNFSYGTESENRCENVPSFGERIQPTKPQSATKKNRHHPKPNA